MQTVRVRTVALGMSGTLIFVVAILVVAPMLAPNRLSVQFYHDGVPVGLPLAVLWNGVPVDTFTVTVYWATDNPSVTAVAIHAEYDLGPVAGIHTVVVMLDRQVLQGTGSFASDTIELTTVVGSWMAPGTYPLTFTGWAGFYEGGELLRTVTFTPITISITWTGYEYTGGITPGA